MVAAPPINSLVVNRSIVANGILDTMRTSELQQVAINNSSHLTILDPKLPLLHEVLGKAASPETNDRAFHCNAFFNLNTVTPWENLVDGGTGYSSKILLQDSETTFNFGRIAELQICSHAWSPLNEASRDCYLGVLTNTGEFLLLQRELLDLGDYTVKYRLLVFLMEQLQLPAQRFTVENDLVLLAQEALFLRITSFQFGKLQDGSLILSLAHENGAFSIYSLGNTLLLLFTETLETNSIVKIEWCAESDSFYFLTADNAVHECKILIDGSNGTKLIKHASRFLVSQIKTFGSSVVIADTKSLYIWNGHNTRTVNLPFWSTIVTICVFESNAINYIFLVYEGGQTTTVGISSEGSIEVLPEPLAWATALSKINSLYQNTFRKEQSKAISATFTPYLDDNIGANVTIHGATVVLGKYLLLAHSGLPKDTITHMYVSLRVFSLTFIPLTTLFEIPSIVPQRLSTFSALIDIFLDTISHIPSFDREVLDGSKAGIESFLGTLSTWKQLTFSSEVETLEPILRFTSIENALITQFRDNPVIRSLQNRYSLNISILKTLSSLTPNPESLSFVREYEQNVIGEQTRIVMVIRERLASLVVTWAAQKRAVGGLSSTDKFIMLSLLQFCGPNTPIGDLPQEAKLTISTDLCTEVFHINYSEPGSKIEASDHLISGSGHGWRLCDLSLLPILNLKNCSDELETHSYLMPQDEESEILDSLLRSINYCIFTGTRKKAIVAGI